MSVVVINWVFEARLVAGLMLVGSVVSDVRVFSVVNAVAVTETKVIVAAVSAVKDIGSWSATS